LFEFAANVLVFTEKPQPERLPLCDVRTRLNCLIDALKPVVETVFERSATGV
jgi:hypothetical protein